MHKSVLEQWVHPVGDPSPADGLPDVIVVSSAYRRTELERLLALLDPIGIPIVVLIRSGNDVRLGDRLRNFKNVHDILRVYPTETARRLTQSMFSTTPPARSAQYFGNLASNRNFAVTAFDGTVVIVDDDTAAITLRHFQQIKSGLRHGLFVGARATAALDNSIASRDALYLGMPEGQFLSGQFLGFNTRDIRSMIPDEYNDDWWWKLMTYIYHLQDGGIRLQNGQNRLQTPFLETDPIIQSGVPWRIGDANLAGQQEHGESAEGLLWMIHIGDPSLRFDLDAWNDYLRDRTAYLKHLTMLADNNKRARYFGLSLNAATALANLPTADQMVQAMRRLDERNREWIDHVDRARNGRLGELFEIRPYSFRPVVTRRITNTLATNGIMVSQSDWDQDRTRIAEISWREPAVAIPALLEIPETTRYSHDAASALGTRLLRAAQNVASAPSLRIAISATQKVWESAWAKAGRTAPTLPKDIALDIELLPENFDPTITPSTFNQWIPTLIDDCECAGFDEAATAATVLLALDYQNDDLLRGEFRTAVNRMRGRHASQSADHTAERVTEDFNRARLLDLLHRESADYLAAMPADTSTIFELDFEELTTLMGQSTRVSQVAESFLRDSNVGHSAKALGMLRFAVNSLVDWYWYDPTDPGSAKVRQTLLSSIRHGHLETTRLQLTCLEQSDDVYPTSVDAVGISPSREVAERDATVAGKRIAVVIPSFGLHALTHELVQQLRADSQDLDVEIFVVDNYDQGSRNRLKTEGEYIPVADEHVIRAGENLGWARGANLGLLHALDAFRPFDGFAVIQNDTRISKGFMRGLVAASQGATVGIVGPSYNTDWTHQIFDYIGPADSYQPLAETTDAPFIDDSCIYMSRDTLLALGGLDTTICQVHGWGVDVVLGMQARELGLTNVVTRLAYLEHGTGATGGNTNEIVHGTDYRLAATVEWINAMENRYGRNWVTEVWQPDHFARPEIFDEFANTATPPMRSPIRSDLDLGLLDDLSHPNCN